jgi:plastocyanin
VLAAALGVLPACGGSGSAPGVEHATGTADWSYVIPQGTGERVDRGEPIAILPAVIDAHVGDVIRIINDDDRGHVLGPFYVGSHESVTQRFTSPGRYRGECSVHTGGELELNVRS